MIFSLRARLKSNSLGLFRIAAALSIFCGLASNAADSIQDQLGLSGSVRPAYWSRDKSFSSNRDFLVGSIWLTMRPPELAGYKFYIDGYLQGSDLARESTSVGDVREFFFEKSWGAFDFKVGRQIVVWGRADKFNPTDSFSSKDLTLLVTDDEDQRKGQGTFQMVYNFDQYRLIGIWQPEWRAPKYPIARQNGVEMQSLTPNQPQNQFGIKLDRTGGDIDWSVSYFAGYNKTPDLKLLAVGSVIHLGLDYGHVQVYGADFAKTIGDFGVRGEAAFTETQDGEGENPFQQNSNFTAVLGADRTLFENFNLNGQILYKKVMNYQDPEQISNANAKTLALQEAINSNQLYEEQAGFSVRPSYKAFNDTLEVEMAYITWFKNTDSILKPKLTYAINDAAKINIGGEFYGGPSNTFFGRLHDVSAVFTEFRYLF